MKKNFNSLHSALSAVSFALLVCFLQPVCAFAGDAAIFEDIGFSSDGKTYIFGQYGKTDGDYQAWAEIYTVDVAENNFVKGEVYKLAPSKETSGRSGRQAYNDLYDKCGWKIGGYNVTKNQKPLYVRESLSKKPTDKISFKDFEASTDGKEIFYNVQLVPSYQGKGINSKSKFYINVEKTDGEGNVILSRKVGSPDFWRKGVSSYRIDRIFTDLSGKSLVFIVEKTQETKEGKSIRYMVETMAF